MQIQPTFQDRVALLNEIGNLCDACDFIYDVRWNRFAFNSDEYHATTRVYQHLIDLISIKWMIYNTINAVAVDS